MSRKYMKPKYVFQVVKSINNLSQLKSATNQCCITQFIDKMGESVK